MLLRACFALLLLLPACAAAQELQLVFSPPASFDSGTFGANGEKGFGFQLQKIGSGTLDGPFTVRITLPEKVAYAGSSGAGASCSAAGQVVTCTVDATLTDWMWSSSGVGVWVDTAADLPAPGSSVLRATLESTQRPLPPVPSCTAPATPSQCIVANVTHRRSQVVFADYWQHHGVWEAGTLQTFTAGWRNTGYSQNNGTVTARFLLPPGVTYSHHGGNIPWVCTAAVANAQGQMLTCTFAYFYDGMSENFNNINVHVNVTESVAVPGPISISGTISNAQQPAPDIASCGGAQPPLGCGFHTGIMTRAKRRSTMDIMAMSHTPTTFTQSAEGMLTVDFANVGDGAAGAMTLEVATPAGFVFDRAFALAPAGQCAATGAAGAPQVVVCQFPQGLPETFAGTVTLVYDLPAGAAPHADVVAAIGDATRPGPTLESCASAPGQAGCGEHAIAVDPGIFCNGVEHAPRTCGRPQPL